MPQKDLDVKNFFLLMNQLENKSSYDANVIKIKNLLSKNPELINMRNGFGATMLFASICFGDQNLVKYLLDLGAEPEFSLYEHDSDPSFYDCRTALNTAIKINPRVIPALLRHEAIDLNAKDSRGYTPLHMAAQYDASLIPTLEEYGADFENIDSGPNLLQLAIMNNTRLIPVIGQGNIGNSVFVEPTNLDILHQLINREKNINFQNKYGQTALHIATECNPNLVAALLEKGANPTIKDNAGYTALEHAVLNQRNKVVNELLSHGVDPNGKVHLKLQIPPNGQKTESMCPILMVAICRNNYELAQILLTHGANSNAVETSEKCTMLELAIKLKNVDMVKLLLENGANPNQTYQNGPSLLHSTDLLKYEASRNNKNRVVEALNEISDLLVEYGASVQEDVLDLHDKTVLPKIVDRQKESFNLYILFPILDKINDLQGTEEENINVIQSAIDVLATEAKNRFNIDIKLDESSDLNYAFDDLNSWTAKACFHSFVKFVCSHIPFTNDLEDNSCWQYYLNNSEFGKYYEDRLDNKEMCELLFKLFPDGEINTEYLNEFKQFLEKQEQKFIRNNSELSSELSDLLQQMEQEQNSPQATEENVREIEDKQARSDTNNASTNIDDLTADKIFRLLEKKEQGITDSKINKIIERLSARNLSSSSNNYTRSDRAVNNGRNSSARRP